MAQEKVFIWLAEEMLKSKFIEWVAAKGHTGISYPTLGRAQNRQYLNAELTARQQKAERLVFQFREEYMQASKAA